MPQMGFTLEPMTNQTSSCSSSSKHHPHPSLSSPAFIGILHACTTCSSLLRPPSNFGQVYMHNHQREFLAWHHGLEIMSLQLWGFFCTLPQNKFSFCRMSSSTTHPLESRHRSVPTMISLDFDATVLQKNILIWSSQFLPFCPQFSSLQTVLCQNIPDTYIMEWYYPTEIY